MSEPITARQFHAAPGVEDWRVLSEGACTLYRTGSFAAAARLVRAIGELPGIDEHPPQVDVRREGVTVRLLTRSDDYWGMGERDIEVARRISDVAREQGLAGDPMAVQTLIMIPGSPRPADVMPFWSAILGYEPRSDSPDEDLVDPHEIGPGFWFEQMDEPRGDGGGAIHVAVWVAPELAEARVKAALAAGGHMVRDDHAPSWWTLADSAGNEADIATVVARD
jgi:4a-hydroxytetrahydrobiopterin dehydratase